MGLQKLGKIGNNLQSVAGADNFSSASTSQGTITTVAGSTLFCNKYRAPGNGLHIQLDMLNRELVETVECWWVVTGDSDVGGV